MGLLGSFLNNKANQYTISTGTSTTTGQPIESLVLLKSNISVFFSNNPRRLYQLFDPGQIAVNTPVVFAEKQILVNQVLEIDSVKYRTIAANPLKFRNRVFGYVAYLERYKH